MVLRQLRIPRRSRSSLSELPGFRRDLLEVMRQPLEEGHVIILRAASSWVR
jgi:predicted ATPase with chaperone activity